jgi:hypothetical protein
MRGEFLSSGKEEGECCTRQKVRMRFKGREKDCHC